MPNSREVAVSRLMCFGNKLQNNPHLLKIVNDKLEDNTTKGYSRKLLNDMASKFESVSLNDLLLKGPDYLEPLPKVLFRFRKRRFAITGEIREMFHQVLIMKEIFMAQL